MLTKNQPKIHENAYATKLAIWIIQIRYIFSIHWLLSICMQNVFLHTSEVSFYMHADKVSFFIHQCFMALLLLSIYTYLNALTLNATPFSPWSLRR